MEEKIQIDSSEEEWDETTLLLESEALILEFETLMENTKPELQKLNSMFLGLTDEEVKKKLKQSIANVNGEPVFPVVAEDSAGIKFFLKKDNLESLKQNLKFKYTDNNKIDRLLYPDNPLSIEACYVQLALIRERDLQKMRSNNSKKITDLDQYYYFREHERIENIQEKLEPEAIFTSCTESPKRIYIEGAAGTGKSTLSRRLAYEWGKEDAGFLENYEWVFYLRLRDLTDREYPEDKDGLIEVLAEQLLTGCSVQQKKIQKEKITEAVFENADKVLWILDGYDELSASIQNCSWWQDLMDTRCDIVMTSRPGHSLPAAFKDNLKLAVLGFSDEQVENYITNFFDLKTTPEIDPAQQVSFLKYIQNDLRLWSLAHTPIQLELLCSVWTKELKQQPNITLTSLYNLITDELLKRSKTKLPKVAVSRLSINDLREEYKESLECLEQLAYLGMERREILFSETLIEECYQLLKQKLKLVNKNDFFEKITTLGLFKYYSYNGKGEYAHLTFQEYFAARYVVRTIREAKKNQQTYSYFLDYFYQNKFNLQLQIVWCFVAGLLKDPVDAEVLDHYFNLLLKKPRDAVVVYELTLFIGCLEQSQLASHIDSGRLLLLSCNQQLFQILLNNFEIGFSSLALLPVAYHLLFLTQFVDSQLLPCLDETPPTVISKQDKHKIIAILGDLTRSIVTPNRVKGLIGLLQDPDINIQISALRALNNLGVKAALLALKDLLIMLNNPDDLVRLTVMELLSKLDKSEDIAKIINSMLEKLQSHDIGIVSNNIMALGNMGEKAATPEVLQTFANILNNPNEHPAKKMAVIQALNNFGKKAGIAELIMILKKQFAQHVQGNEVARTLTSIGSESVVAWVIEAQLNKLQTSDAELRGIIVNELGQYGEAGAIPAVINRLPQLLQDPDIGVKIFAMQTCGNLYKKAATPEVIKILLELFEQEYSAREFWGKQIKPKILQTLQLFSQANNYIEESIVKKIILTLLIALKNSDEVNKSSMVLTLSLFYKKLTTPEVISEILQIINQKDTFVSSLSWILNNLGIENIVEAVPTILQKFLNGLCSQEDNIRNLMVAELQQLSHLYKTMKRDILEKLIQLILKEGYEKRIMQNVLQAFFRVMGPGALIVHDNQLQFYLAREKSFLLPLSNQDLNKLKILLQRCVGVTNFEIVTPTSIASSSSVQQGEFIEKKSLPLFYTNKFASHPELFFEPFSLAKSDVPFTMVLSSENDLISKKISKQNSIKKYLLSELVEIKDKSGDPLALPRLVLQHAVRLEFKKILSEKLLPFFEKNKFYSEKHQKTIFMSYAWAIENSDTYDQDKLHEGCVEKIAKDLERIGCKVYLDRWFDQPGNVLSDFLELMGKADFFIPIGTRLYLEKYEKRIDRENAEEHEHVIRTEGQILSYIAGHSSRLQKKIIPILLESTSETTLPLLLRTQLPLMLHKDDYFDNFFAITKKIYGIDNRHKEFEVLTEEFFKAIQALQIQLELELKEQIVTMKRSGSPLHQMLPIKDAAPISMATLSEGSDAPNFP